MNLAICRFLSDVDKTEDDEGRGFIEYDYQVDEEKVREMREGLDAAIGEGQTIDMENEGKKVLRYYSTENEKFEERFEHLEEVVNHLKGDIESYYGSYFEPIYIHAMRYPSGNSEHYARSWHLDEYSPDSIRLFVLLTDTDEGDGSSVFLDRSDTMEALGKVDENFTYDEEFWSKWEKSHFYGEEGSVALAKPASNFHRGTNQSGERDIAIVTLQPATERLEDDWLEETEFFESEQGMMRFSSLLRTLKNIFA